MSSFSPTPFRQAYPAFDAHPAVDGELERAFLGNSVHDALAACAAMRPPCDISVSLAGSEGAGSVRPELV